MKTTEMELNDKMERRNKFFDKILAEHTDAEGNRVALVQCRVVPGTLLELSPGDFWPVAADKVESAARALAGVDETRGDWRVRVAMAAGLRGIICG